jgi:hypothetical protein
MALVVNNCHVLDVFPLMMCSAAHWLFIFHCVGCNSEYQVHVMKYVRYVGWATSSRATVKIRLYVFKKKKKKNESSQ